MTKKDDDQFKVVATNRKAYHDYFIEEKLEAGVMLHGTEVKSPATDASPYKTASSVKDGEFFPIATSALQPRHIMNHDPIRSQLLLHKKRSILMGRRTKGLTISTPHYFSNAGMPGRDRIAKGKKLYDRRNHQDPRSEPRSRTGDQG